MLIVLSVKSVSKATSSIKDDEVFDPLLRRMVATIGKELVRHVKQYLALLSKDLDKEKERLGRGKYSKYLGEGAYERIAGYVAGERTLLEVEKAKMEGSSKGKAKEVTPVKRRWEVSSSDSGDSPLTKRRR